VAAVRVGSPDRLPMRAGRPAALVILTATAGPVSASQPARPAHPTGMDDLMLRSQKCWQS
jgi:hypothetical protein